jgi:hypothetical protein
MPLGCSWKKGCQINQCGCWKKFVQNVVQNVGATTKKSLQRDNANQKKAVMNYQSLLRQICSLTSMKLRTPDVIQW